MDKEIRQPWPPVQDDAAEINKTEQRTENGFSSTTKEDHSSGLSSDERQSKDITSKQFNPETYKAIYEAAKPQPTRKPLFEDYKPSEDYLQRLGGEPLRPTEDEIADKKRIQARFLAFGDLAKNLGTMIGSYAGGSNTQQSYGNTVNSIGPVQREENKPLAKVLAEYDAYRLKAQQEKQKWEETVRNSQKDLIKSSYDNYQKALNQWQKAEDERNNLAYKIALENSINTVKDSNALSTRIDDKTTDSTTRTSQTKSSQSAGHTPVGARAGSGSARANPFAAKDGYYHHPLRNGYNGAVTVMQLVPMANVREFYRKLDNMLLNGYDASNDVDYDTFVFAKNYLDSHRKQKGKENGFAEDLNDEEKAELLDYIMDRNIDYTAFGANLSQKPSATEGSLTKLLMNRDFFAPVQLDEYGRPMLDANGDYQLVRKKDGQIDFLDDLNNDSTFKKFLELNGYKGMFDSRYGREMGLGVKYSPAGTVAAPSAPQPATSAGKEDNISKFNNLMKQ